MTNPPALAAPLSPEQRAVLETAIHKALSHDPIFRLHETSATGRFNNNEFVGVVAHDIEQALLGRTA